MLFNSLPFIFLFLPATLLGFYVIGNRGPRLAIAWLIVASLFFYGWWNPPYLVLILSSVAINYSVGTALSSRPNRSLLIFGLAANLTLLGYFKYANFFVDNINGLAGSNLHLGPIILPLAISFFTFQQIAYLIDAYRGETLKYGFPSYALFVTFFPQLIAGPIVSHSEMMPQFSNPKLFRFRMEENLGVGLAIFLLGLSKKILVAEQVLRRTSGKHSC
jgi:alginate O-acetyltransferase complex protein AlgI